MQGRLGGTACSGGATQCCRSRGSRAARYVSTCVSWAKGRGTVDNYTVLVLPADLVHVPTLDLATVSIPTQKATTPFLCQPWATYLLTYYLLDLNHHHTSKLQPALPFFPPSRDSTCLIFIPNLPTTPPPSSGRVLSNPPLPPPVYQHQCLADSCARRSIVSVLPPCPSALLESHPPGRVRTRALGGRDGAPSTCVRVAAPRGFLW